MIHLEEDQIQQAWDNIATGYDQFVTPTHMWLANESLRRAEVQSGMQFVDVAAGSGALSIPAARLGAKVLSIDISAVMLQQLEARARKEGLNIETRLMDGHALKLNDNTFDVAASQFGVMLFQDMPRGIRELARVTKPGGKVLLNVYGNPAEIDFIQFFIAAIQAVVPEFIAPMDPPPLPFQLQNLEKLRSEMTTAGLSDIRIETIWEELHFESGKRLWNWLVNSNPIALHILDELKLTKEQLKKVQEALEIKIRDRAGKNKIAVLTNPIHIAIGIK
jgi:ubiquinone/menaquinone biosynthesis C-methylase UbiE